MSNLDDQYSLLSGAQVAAFNNVAAMARRAEVSARERVAEFLTEAGCDTPSYANALAQILDHARVVLHFHPDRYGNGTTSVAATLLRDGVYRNQFETGLSTGSPTAFVDGARDTWERNLFGGAFHADGVAAAERPKYGALELVRFPDGPIPRFGSCYFVLKPHVSRRTTFTFMGSEDPRAPERLGTIDAMHSVMAELLAEIAAGGTASPPWPPFRAPTLGLPDLTIARLFDVLRELSNPRRDPVGQGPGRVLDTVIEAHVHGPIDLRRDVEFLIADRAFADTATGTILRDLAMRFGFAFHWHDGFRLPVRDVPEDFRGPKIPVLARRIAGADGMLDAAIIGAAAATLQLQPQAWHDWANPDETLQHFRQLWHVLVHYGSRAC